MAIMDEYTKSYEKIDYSVRPAKCIERKMLCDIFRKLAPFGEVKKYRYIGFGSPFFADFYLFHKMLGIEDMISIEKNKEDKDRFEFNTPFSCIKMKYGNSNDVLPLLEWDIRTILWLDYDFTLNNSVLEDVKTAFSSVREGSIVIITVDGNIRDEFGDRIEEKSKKLKQLENNIDKEKIARGIKEKNLDGWECSDVFKGIITNEIQETINARNGGRSKGNKLIYKQLFNFYYSDGTKMLTVGGIIFDEGNIEKFHECGFEKMSFYRNGNDPCKIKIPKLTLKEIKQLDKFLPDNYENAPEFIPEDQRKMYKNIYTYFPHYAEAFI